MTRTKSPVAKRIVIALLTLALVAAIGWAVWLYGISRLVSDGLSDVAISKLKASWASATKKPEYDEVAVPASEAFAIVEIPRFGKHYRRALIHGIDWKDRLSGLGWYPSSAHPGQLGNMAITGNRVTDGAALADIDSLQRGDQVHIETAHARYTYTIVVAPKDLRVAASDDWVLQPVPGKPNQIVEQSILTITTSHDLVPTNQRSVGFGVLTETKVKK